jgi:hypothetical protein
MYSERRDLLGWTWDDAQSELEPWSLQSEPRPQAYRYADTMYFRLESSGWLAAQGKMCVRYARVCSPKVDIATLMIYPTAGAEHIPVFASEWLIVGAQCQRVVLDIEPAAPSLHVARTLPAVCRALGEKWQKHLPTHTPFSPWFATLAQPWAIHSGCDVSALAMLRESFQDYLQTYIQLVNAALPTSPSGMDAVSVTQYKRHHAEHFPGRVFLARVLGEEWVDTYLYEHHFGRTQNTPSFHSPVSGASSDNLSVSTRDSVVLSSKPAASAY